MDVAPTIALPHSPRTVALDEGRVTGALDEDFARRYRADKQLGAGGMGEVNLCGDGRIGREVAMKLALRGGGDGAGSSDGEERFLREARIQGQLEHPSIVPVYDIGRDPLGRIFFTMKRVRGETLAAVLASKSPAYTQRKLLAAFARVCLAVDFAHSRGVVHRDLKPANVMLGDFGEVYLLDWGLAKVAGTRDPARDEPPTTAEEPTVDSTPRLVAGSSGPTRYGSILGTPGYMSPEQARGELDRVDARSDVYALGALLFEILAGEPLHRRLPSASAETSDTLAATAAGPGFVPADARVSVRRPGRAAPPELEAICVRACQLDPEGRYPSAREVHDALERYLDGDRDLMLRRSISATHLARAEAAAHVALDDKRATAESKEARTSALAEVGRALALDPDSTAAAEVLMRLLTQPPAEVPAAVEAEAFIEARDGQARVSRQSARLFGIWFLLAPLLALMGVRRWSAVAATSLAFGLASLQSWIFGRRPHPQGKIPYVTLAVMALLLGTVALLFGPFLLAPTVAVSITVALSMAPDRSRRLAVIATMGVAVTVPLLLEWLAVLPPSYAYQGDALVILPRALAFSAPVTPIFFLLSTLGLIVAAAMQAFTNRDLLSEVQRQVAVNAWQLRQLVRPSAVAAERDR